MTQIVSIKSERIHFWHTITGHQDDIVVFPIYKNKTKQKAFNYFKKQETTDPAHQILHDQGPAHLYKSNL